MNRLYGELLAVTLLLSLTLFVSSYSNFVIQGKAISQSGIPDWAGAPWSLFDSASIEDIRINDELVSVRNVVYGADSTSFDVFAKGDYVWSDGWIWDGARWQKISFSPNFLQGGGDEYVNRQTRQGWISKAAVSRQSMRLSAGSYWIVAYTCQWVNGQWKCGCRTTTDCNKWQIQSFSAGVLDRSISEDMGRYLQSPGRVPGFFERAARIDVPDNGPATEPRADFTDDGKVDFDDFFAFADVFGSTDVKYDLSGNGRVDYDDFYIFADNFGKRASSSRRASIKVTADDEYEIYMNERLVGRGDTWRSPEIFNVQMVPGENVIAAIARDNGGDEGLLVEIPDASSDNTWRAKLISEMSDYERETWKQPGFDDSEWEVPTENRRKSVSERPSGFSDAKWIWGRTTRAGRLADGYAFRKVINVIDEEIRANAVDAVLNNDIVAIKSLPDPLRKVAVDQYSLNNRDVSNCNAGTEDCIQKTLYFSCDESDNKEQCEADILRQSEIPSKNAFPRLHVDYGNNQDTRISKERTFLYPNRRVDYCEMEIDWNTRLYGSNKVIIMSTPGRTWSFQRQLRDVTLNNIRIVREGGELVRYYCPSEDQNFPCYILNNLINSNREEYICTGKYWLGCNAENPTNTGIIIEGTNYFCGSSGWRGA